MVIACDSLDILQWGLIIKVVAPATVCVEVKSLTLFIEKKIIYFLKLIH